MGNVSSQHFTSTRALFDQHEFVTMRTNLDLIIKPLPASNALSQEGEKAILLQWGTMWRSSDALLLKVHAAATR